MAASRILRLARTRRCAKVASGTRKAWAISGVVRPPRVRRVSATRASSDSAGWQQVKMSRSRSSPMVCICFPVSASSCPAWRSASRSAKAVCRSASPRSRRSRSMALLRAVVVIQAPGFGGTPSAGQRSQATRNASATASSARSKSPSRRMRVATALPDSSRKTCWTLSPTSAATLATAPPRFVPLAWISAHVGELHDRPHLYGTAVGAGDPGRGGDCFVEVPAVHDVEAAELLLGLGEGPVGGERLAAAHLHRGGGAGWLQRLAGLHQPSVDDILGEGVVGVDHGLPLRLGRGRHGRLGAVDQQCVAHLLLPFCLCWCGAVAAL